MKIVLANDHHGIDLKGRIISYLNSKNIEYINLGCDEKNNVDYVDYAKLLCECIKDGKADYGILICGTGIGMSIAANKVKGIRAAVCTDHFSTKFTRLHNNTNVLCLGGRVLGDLFALELVDIFLNTEYEGGRHQRRIDMITAIEKKYMK